MPIQLKRGTTSQWSSQNPVLSVGEPGYDTILKILKVGDGVTAWNSLSQYGVGPTGATGASGTGGQVVINFGTGLGSNETSLFINDTNVLVTSKAVASIAAVPTADHTEQDHTYAASFISLSCDTPIAGSGFTIYARCIMGSLSGTFTVNYSWI